MKNTATPKMVLELVSKPLMHLPRKTKDTRAWMILLDIAGSGERGVPVTAAASAGDQPTTTGYRRLAWLEEEGLIYRSADAGDGRTTWLRLTPRGMQCLADSLASVERILQRGGWTRD